MSWPAGGGTDIATRIVAKYMREVLGQDIQVVNIPGGGGAIGYVEAARRPPNGYNLVALQFDILSVEAQGLAPVSYRAFHPIGLFATQPIVLVASPKSEIQSVKDFIAAATRMAGKLNVGGASIGGVWHQAAVLIQDQLNVSFNYVPFNGLAELLPALLAGHIDVAVAFLTGMEGYVRTGAIRVLGVAASERLRDFPNVPTFRELGYDVTYAGFYGLGVPRGTPEAFRKVLENALKQAFDHPGFQTEISNRALNPTYLSASEFEAYLARLYGTVKRVMDKIQQKL